MRNKTILLKAILILAFFQLLSPVYSSNSNSTLILADVIITSDYNGFSVSCHGGSDGSAMVIPSGGQAPYEYIWSNGAGTQEAFGLSAGQYFITVTDATFSSIIVEAFLTEPPMLALSIAQNSSASLEATAGGGFPPYSFLWSTGDADPLLNNLSTGTYSVTVTDFNGCSEVADYTLSSQTTLTPNWEVVVTNENHTILIPDSILFTINGDTAEVGDMMGIFYDSLGTLKCGGYITWTGVTTALIAYGNDPITPAIDGFDQGAEFQWKVWDVSEEEEFLAEPEYNLVSFVNDGHYATNGISGLSKLVGYDRHGISIPTGWSIMSTYVDPFDPNFESVLSEIAQDLIVIKNEEGELYYPQWNLNMIGDFVIGEGYEVKMNDNGGLKSGFYLYVDGERVDPDTGIPLPEGWSIISYLHRENYPIEDMMESIDTAIVIVKDGAGQVYIPNYPGGPINQIVEMKPGKGYKIKILAGNNVILFYPDSIPATKIDPFIEPYPAHKYFAEVKNTGSNHSFIFMADALSGRVYKGDEIGLFVNDVLVGSRVYMNNNLVIPAFGNDEFTEVKDGALTDDEISIKIWKKNEDLVYDLKDIVWSEGDAYYETDKISAAEDFVMVLNDSFEENISVYPNPNNGIFNISQKLSGDIILMEIFAVDGKKVFVSEGNEFMKTNYDFSHLPSGVYNISVTTNKSILVEQFIIQ